MTELSSNNLVILLLQGISPPIYILFAARTLFLEFKIPCPLEPLSRSRVLSFHDLAHLAYGDTTVIIPFLS